VALVLASAALRKFGGDSVDELVRNAEAFRASLRGERNSSLRGERDTSLRGDGAS